MGYVGHLPIFILSSLIPHLSSLISRLPPSLSRSLPPSLPLFSLFCPIFSDINATITVIVETLKPFQHTGKLLSEIMDPPDYLTFVMRWNYLHAELKKAAHFLSVHNFKLSLYHSQVRQCVRQCERQWSAVNGSETE